MQFGGEKNVYLTKFLPKLGTRPEKIKVIILAHVIYKKTGKVVNITIILIFY